MTSENDNACNNDKREQIARAVDKRTEQLDELELTLNIELAGVAQALDTLRKALDKVEECIDNRQYRKIANLGYEDVSGGFIFLQRTMGSLLTASDDREEFISDIAGELKLAYEIVEPIVEAEARRRDSH